MDRRRIKRDDIYYHELVYTRSDIPIAIASKHDTFVFYT